MAGQPKREPIAHAVDPGAVSQLGTQTGRPKEDIYQGRGYEAPKNTSTIHDCGSQGKH